MYPSEIPPQVDIPPLINPTTPKNTLSYNTFRNGYKDYNKKTLNHSKTDEWKSRHKHEWSRKQLCFQHQLYPELIQKYFSNIEMPSSLFKICQCGKLQKKIKSSYKPILRLSLDKALKTSHWKMKSAHFTNLNINITDSSLPNNNTYIHNTIQMIKIKIGAVKRYTQPKTNIDVFATASFYKKNVFWQMDPQHKYILEIRLKSRECKQEVKVNTNDKAKDVAPWWYQCWGLHGIREERNNNNINNTNNNTNLYQFFAIHDNTFVHKTSLHHSIQRVCIWLYKKKSNMNNIKATINGISMINTEQIRAKLHSYLNNNNNCNHNKKSQDEYNNNSNNLSQNSSQNSSQAQPRSQTPSQTYFSQNSSHNSPKREIYFENNNGNVNGKNGNGLKRSWDINNDMDMKMSDDYKDKLIIKLQKKIMKLEKDNHELTTNLRRLNRTIVQVPLSGELRFSQEYKDNYSNVNILSMEPAEPPLKKRRLNE